MLIKSENSKTTLEPFLNKRLDILKSEEVFGVCADLNQNQSGPDLITNLDLRI